MELTRQKKESVTYYFQYRPTDISFILAETGYTRICSLPDFYYSLDTFVNHPQTHQRNTLFYSFRLQFQLFFTWNGSMFFFHSLMKRRFGTYQLYRATGFLIFIGKLHRTIFFYTSMHHFHYWLLPKSHFSKLVISAKKLWDSFDDWLWDCR